MSEYPYLCLCQIGPQSAIAVAALKEFVDYAFSTRVGHRSPAALVRRLAPTPNRYPPADLDVRGVSRDAMETKDDGEEMPEHQPALVALVGDFRRDNDAAHLTNAIHAMKDVSKAGLFVIGALPEAHGTVQGQRCKDRGARTETQGTVHGQLLERCDGVINVTHGLDLYAQVAIATRGLFDGLFVHGLIGYDDIDMLTAMHTGDVFSFDRCNELPALRPLPNGPWVFARHDIVAAAAARQATGQTDRRRRIRGVDPSSEQRNLEITNT